MLEVLFRVFKRERVLQVWASDAARGPLTPVATYEVCYASGKLGPKRREGDRQVPEGFYRLGYFNPLSSFHLSMLVTYPNASDRLLGHPTEPGGEIMIHGNCVSIGCVAMSDERIEELWLIAREGGVPAHVHIFPTEDIDGLLRSGEQPEHHAFWQNLREGLVRFEQNKELPAVSVAPDGRYRFR